VQAQRKWAIVDAKEISMSDNATPVDAERRYRIGGRPCPPKNGQVAVPAHPEGRRSDRR
jgi:hypothetical protein